MLNVDISNMWCSVTLPTLLESEQDIARAHAAVADNPAMHFLPWLETAGESQELERILKTAESIRSLCQVLVVVGNESAVQGAQAALELCQGQRYNLKDGGPLLLFAGSDFSTASWLSLSELLENRDFCVMIVSRDGAAVQTALTVRSLRWILERRYGTEKARERVFVVTDPDHGNLRQISMEEGYCAFNLPPMLAGHGSVLSPAALLPLAVAGVDIRALLVGAAEAAAAMSGRSFENPAWLYAAGRTILAQKGRRVEILTSTEPDTAALGRWWQGLFAQRACGPDGLTPVSVQLPGDWFSMHPLLLDSRQPLVQTLLRFGPPEQKVPVEMDWKDADGLNFLEGFTLDFVQEQAINGMIEAVSEAGIPQLAVECEAVSPATVGQLLYFFELTSCLCAELSGLDCHAARTIAPHVAGMMRQLGKPGF